MTKALKNLILDYPRQALAFFAAEESGDDLDNARVIPIRQEQLMERLGERFRELDAPLLVEWPNGEREAILFVVEEETETSRFSIHRLAHYYLDLAELMGTERVVPVVIFIDYYANLSDEEIIQYRECYLTERGELMGLAQLLRQEGKQEGIREGKREGRQEGKREGRQEGRQEGKQEGEAVMLLRLVEKRFGSVSDDIRVRIQAADADTLLRWADRLFSAQTIEAVFE